MGKFAEIIVSRDVGETTYTRKGSPFRLIQVSCKYVTESSVEWRSIINAAGLRFVTGDGEHLYFSLGRGPFYLVWLSKILWLKAKENIKQWWFTRKAKRKGQDE